LQNTSILSVAAIEAPEVVTSSEFDDILAPTLDRLGLRRGMLQQVAGIEERRWWPEGVTYSECAAKAGAQAIEAAGISPDQIGLLIDTSVSRARLEPSSAVFVHNELGLPSSCINFDLSNACLGFVNGMQLAATMIDSGQIDYALIVDAEGSRVLQQRTIERLQGPDTTTADILSEFAALTLGSGAAGMVLGRSDRHPDGHRFVNVVSRAATEHHDLCLGDMDRMVTDSRAMLLAGLEVAEIAMKEASLEFDWQNLQHYIVHQVSTVHCDMLIQRLGLDSSRVPVTFPTMGNMGPAAIPITLALHQDKILPGDRVLMMGMGSGINAMAAEIVW
jgi:acyl-CoA:acyl-CoA alkyltransferase